MANPHGNKPGPTRDWTPLMNIMVAELVKSGKPRAGLESGFTHVYEGSIRKGMSDIKHLGVSPESVQKRLLAIGWMKNDGKIAEFQGTTRWLVRNEEISPEDASRADTLVRAAHPSSRKHTRRSSAERKDARYEVKDDELHPGKQVIQKPNGPGELERLLRENRHLEEQVNRLNAECDDWKDEAEKFREEVIRLRTELNATGTDDLKRQVGQLETIVKSLLLGGGDAEMLRRVAELGRP